MDRKDFQDRLVGSVLAVILIWLAIVIGSRIWTGFFAATDSGPMYTPSDWRK